MTKILDDLPDLGHTSFSSSTAGGAGGGGRLSRRSSAGSSSGLLRTVSSGSVAIGEGVVADGEAAGACDEYLERQLRDMVRLLVVLCNAMDGGYLKSGAVGCVKYRFSR